MKHLITKLSIIAILLSGCSENTVPKEDEKQQTNLPFSVTFHNGTEVNTQVVESNGTAFLSLDIPDHTRFVGWTTQEGSNTIAFYDNTINYSEIADFLNNGATSIDLYAVYQAAAVVNFYIDDYSEEKEFYEGVYHEQSINVPYKVGHQFAGWSVNADFSTLDFEAITEFSYVDVASLLDANNSLSLYAVYSEKASKIKTHQYNSSDEMAEIHIATKNGLAIDDKSLIDPVEKKGKNGELDVYNYVDATITVSNCEAEYVLNNIPGKVKVRGNYTSTYDKKPIRIKYNSKQKMLGLNDGNAQKSWVLLASWKDSSNIRDAVAYFLGNSLLEGDGLYTSDFRFVKVYLNDSYNGVYLLVEQQQIDAHRVNIPESKSETDSEKTGYFLEFDGYYANEAEMQKFTISYNDVKTGNNGFTIQNDIMNQAQYNYIKKVVQNIWKVVYDAIKKPHYDLSENPYHTIDADGNYVADSSITTAEEATSKVINIDSLVDMYIIHEICEDRDIGWSSFYFSIDMSEKGDKKLTFNAPWDFDYALGNNTFGNAMTATIKSRTTMVNEGRMTKSGENYTLKKNTILKKDDFKFANADSLYCEATDNPWFIVFSSQNWLWTRIFEKWSEAQEAGVFTRLIEMIETLSNKYVAQFEENYTKWSKSMGLKLNGYQPDVVKYFVTQKQASEYLVIWLNERINGLSTAIQNKIK